MKQGWFPLSCLFILNFEALYPEHDPSFLCYMSWFNSWFVLLWSLPRLGIPRLLWITRGQSKELVTIAIKGEIFLSLYNPSGELSRQAQVLAWVTKADLPPPLWSSLLHPAGHWRKMLDFTFTVEGSHTFIIRAVSTRKADMRHTLLTNILIPCGTPKRWFVLLSVFLKQPIQVLIPSPWYHTTSLFKILDIIYSKRSTRYPG